MTKSQAIDTMGDWKKGADLNDRLVEITQGIENRTGFRVKNILWKSDYYGSGKLGAINYEGEYKGEKAVLKIQGAKPMVSEIEMVEKFEKQNKSKIIRAPRILESIAWQDENGYEAIVMELVEGKKIIEEHRLASTEEIEEFFDVYSEYKENCVRRPWLQKPTKEINVEEAVLKGWEMGKQIKPDNPHRQDSDLDLLETGVNVLEKIKTEIPVEFLHGHLSVNDLIKTSNGDIVVFSNLFWKWKQKYYDAVFAYHWHRYTLANSTEISREEINKQQSMWIEAMENLPEVKNSTAQLKWLKAARLERAMAGLALDSFAYIDSQNRLAGYMVEMTRDEVKRLISELK